MNEADFLTVLEANDGLEIHVESDGELYALAKRLKKKGKVVISPRRGPGRAWVRVELAEEDEGWRS